MWYYKTILNDTSRLPRCEITPDFSFQTFGTVDNVTYIGVKELMSLVLVSLLISIL